MQNEENINRQYYTSNQQEYVEMLPPSPDNPPWNGWMALGVWILSIVFIIVFPIIFIAPYLIQQKANVMDQTALTELLTKDKTSILIQLIAIIPAHIFTLLAAWLVVTRWRKYSFREMLGWEWNGFKIWHAIVITVFFYALAIALKLVFPEQENEMDKLIHSSRAAVYLVAFFATFTAPIVEEVVYRGVLYSALQRKFGIILAVAFVTILFAAIHIPQYSSNNVPDFAAIIILVLLSLTLTMIRVKTKNLLPCIILHTIFNGIQSILLICEPWLQSLYDHSLPKTEDVPGIIFHLLK